MKQHDPLVLPAFKFKIGSGLPLAAKTGGWSGIPVNKNVYTTPIAWHQGGWLAAFLLTEPETALSSSGTIAKNLGQGAGRTFTYRQLGTAFGTTGTPMRMPNTIIYTIDLCSSPETTPVGDKNDFPLGSGATTAAEWNSAFTVIDGWLTASGLTTNNVFTGGWKIGLGSNRFLAYPFPGYDNGNYAATNFVGGNFLFLVGIGVNSNSSQVFTGGEYWDITVASEGSGGAVTGNVELAQLALDKTAFEASIGRFNNAKIIIYFRRIISTLTPNQATNASAAAFTRYGEVAALYPNNITLRGPYEWDASIQSTVQADIASWLATL